jgi:hypothetical protein
MTYEEIERFMTQKHPGALPVQISFKTRKSFKGIFLRLDDYDELRKKNLWRIVSESNIDSYKSSMDNNLSRIFNGSEMTRLEMIR